MTDTHRRPPSSSRLSPEEIINRGFASAFRGVSETEVRNFLRRVADDIAAARAREAELTRQIEELQDQLANPPPVTEQQLLDSLGEETARVLRSAQDAGEEIRKRAEERAAEVVADAQATATRLREEADQAATSRTEEAEHRATELEQESEARATQEREALEREVTERRERAAAEAEALREQAEQTAELEIANAKTSSYSLVDEARTVRERVLADLARRRSLLQAQVDELRSGRDRLLDAYRVVKHTLGDATGALAQVEARANAELAAPLPRISIPPVEGELEMLESADDASEPPADDGGSVEIDLEVESGIDRGEGPGPDRAPAGDSPNGESREMPDADSGAAVDALFARLRASHTADPAPGVALPPAGGGSSGPAPAEAKAGDTKTGDQVGPEKSEGKGAAKAEPPAPAAAKGEPPKPSVDAPTAQEATADASDGPALTGDDALRAERDEVLGPMQHDLLRRAKRALQDQQNEILDKIRTIKGRVESGAVLADEATQEAAWATVLREPLTTAYARSYTAVADPDGPTPALPTELVDEIAKVMVDPWRRRLVAAIDGAGEDSDAITQRLGARYREYKGKELDAALGDALAAAWARGTFDAAPEGSLLRWVPAEVGRCPDCDDNALEPTARSEPFPTGQLFPPAHPGCRCFLALAEPGGRSR
jgi:DivIVA domain-containing protein